MLAKESLQVVHHISVASLSHLYRGSYRWAASSVAEVAGVAGQEKHSVSVVVPAAVALELLLSALHCRYITLDTHVESTRSKRHLQVMMRRRRIVRVDVQDDLEVLQEVSLMSLAQGLCLVGDMLTSSDSSSSSSSLPSSISFSPSPSASWFATLAEAFS